MTPDLERQIQSRLTVKAGDTLTREQLDAIEGQAKQIDEHVWVVLAPSGGSVGFTLLFQAPSGRVGVVGGLAQAGAKSNGGAPAPPPPPPPPELQGIAQVSQTLASANVIQKVPPQYPAIAKSARVQGTVHLFAVIGPDGHVQQVFIADGPALLQTAAADAVKQWVYKPFQLNGQPATVATQVDVVFQLL
jgi:protein TonB